MLACTSAPSLKVNKLVLKTQKIEVQLEQGLITVYLYVHVSGPAKSTMAAQITPSYIFGDI